MRYEILWSPEAIEDWKRLKATDRTFVKEGIEIHLRHEPKKFSRSRIKKLRKVIQPQYRLRIGEFRVFYDVAATSVNILAVVSKSQSASWLDQKGEKEK